MAAWRDKSTKLRRSNIRPPSSTNSACRISPAAGSLPRDLQVVFASIKRTGLRSTRTASARPLLAARNAGSISLGLVRLGIEASPPTLLRRVPSHLTLVRCPGWSNSEDGHPGEPRNNFLQKLQSFSAYLRGKRGQSSNVPTRPRKAGDEPIANRIGILRHDNGNRDRRFLGGTGCCRTSRDNDLYLETDQFSGKAGRRSSFPSAYRHSITMFFPPRTQARADPAGMPRCGPDRGRGSTT